MKALRLILAACLSMAAAPALAQPARFDSAVDLPKGTVLEVSATLKVKREGGTTTPPGYSRRWRQSVTPTDAGYRIEQRLLSPDPASLPAGEALGQGHQITYLADESLGPIEVMDWDRIRTATLNELAKGQVTHTNDFRKLFAEIDSKEAADAILMGPSLLAIPQNMVLEIGKPHTYSNEAPMPVGGLIIKVNGSYTLTALDQKTGLATVVWDEVLDPKSTSEAVVKAATTLIPKEQIGKFGEIRLERTLHCDFTMDIRTGLTRDGVCLMTNKVSFTKDPTVAGQTETWTLSQRIVTP